MAKQKKKKLSAKAFTAVVTPLLALLLAFTIALCTIAPLSYDLVLRDIFGETEFNFGDAANGVDAEYYTRDITDSEELQAQEQAFTRKAGAEGFVLLYNKEDAGKGLPVEAGSKLSLFSASSVDLLAGGTGSGVSTISSDMRTALLEQGFSAHHDIVAFTRAVSETLGEERKWVHYGLTSTDVVDTANGYLIKQANEILLKDIEDFIEMLRKQALRFKNTPCIGRTHGIHADITCFGLKWVLW